MKTTLYTTEQWQKRMTRRLPYTCCIDCRNSQFLLLGGLKPRMLAMNKMIIILQPRKLLDSSVQSVTEALLPSKLPLVNRRSISTMMFCISFCRVHSIQTLYVWSVKSRILKHRYTTDLMPSTRTFQFKRIAVTALAQHTVLKFEVWEHGMYIQIGAEKKRENMVCHTHFWTLATGLQLLQSLLETLNYMQLLKEFSCTRCYSYPLLHAYRKI